MKKFLSDIPHSTIGEFSFRRSSWGVLDNLISSKLKADFIILPSVRLGTIWILEYLKYNRSENNILVPKFLSRCLLNSITRSAFPVKIIDKNTKLFFVVDEFGFTNDRKILDDLAKKNNSLYIEDEPYSIKNNIEISNFSIGKFISLSKLLPTVHGAAFLTNDKNLKDFLKSKRNYKSLYSFILFWALFFLKAQYTFSSSKIVEGFVEMFPYIGGGSWFSRSNILSTLDNFDQYERETLVRINIIKRELEKNIMVPDDIRLLYQIPYFINNNEIQISNIFKEHSLHFSILNINISKNFLVPDYRLCVPIPLNPKIPRNIFENLINDIKSKG